MRIKVLTINIAGVQFDWFEGRRVAFITALKEINADIIFLQETTVVPEKHYDQTLDLMTGAGLAASAFVPSGNEREFESPKLGGVGILSRWPFQFVQNRRLPAGKLDPYGARCAVFASINIQDKNLLLATTHLSYREEEENLRYAQTKVFLDTIHLYPHDYVIFGGDFNEKEHGPSVKKIMESYNDSGYRGETYNERRIDYLFYSRSIELFSSKVVSLPSDHSGVVSEFDF